MTPLELLAPARTADIGIAAIRCGADAVYIGGPAFGARSAAWNSVDDIARLCDAAAPFGVRIYVTVNTLAADDREREQIVRTMLSMRGKGVGAFILQDTSLLPLLYECGIWKEEFHASTQCAIRTPERARELADMGFTRLILERELSLGQVSAIRRAVPQVELEFFVHGALCVCYSGDCYLSEMLTGRSANRGECAQPCRSLYDLVDSDGKKICSGKPILSLRDLNLKDKLEDLSEAGISSFKIEGRLKSESYVKNVVRSYDIALNALVRKFPDRFCRASSGRVEGGFVPNLEKTFNRGYTSLFIDGTRSTDWNSEDAAKGMGEYLGRVADKGIRKAGADSMQIEIDTGASIANGDGLCFVGTGGQVIGFRADKAQGRKVFCKMVEGLRPGTKVWRNHDAAFEKELACNMPQRLVDVDVTLRIDSARLVASGGGCLESAAIPHDAPRATDQQRMQMVLQSQISKISQPYRFHLAGIESDGPLPLLGAAFLNSLRRSLAVKLQKTSEEKNREDARDDWKQPILPSLKEESKKKAGGSHPRREGELMRSKYCIRYQMGMCLMTGKDKQRKGMFLVNNTVRIPLKFDCAGCEMVLQEGNPVLPDCKR